MVSGTGASGRAPVKGPPPTRLVKGQEVGTLGARTPKGAVFAKLGKPFKEDNLDKPTANVDSCYRWRASNRAGGLITGYKHRICFDDRTG